VSEELEDLLTAGERAAFHGRPAAGVNPLQQAVELAHAAGRDAEATAAAWLLGVCLAASGRYGSALSVLDGLAAHDPQEADKRLFCSLAAATVGSIHRQLGRHADGQHWDNRALAMAGSADEALFDAHIGLAADAVGLGDSPGALAEIAVAEQVADGRTEWWRQRVRLDWVRAEVALLQGRPEEAARRAATAVSIAETSQAPRHVAKGLLFAGISFVQAGDLDEATAVLRRSASLAESLGSLPLVWPSRAMLGALVEISAPEEAQKSIATARAAVRTISDDLPPALAAEWTARADVVALLED